MLFSGNFSNGMKPVNTRFVLICALCLLVAGCWNPFNPEREEPAPATGQFETKEAVILTYETAYVTQDRDLYEQCLADSFLFFFSPFDRAALDSLGVRDESWGKTQEIENTTRIFNTAESINFKITVSSETDLSGNGTEFLMPAKIDLTVMVSGQIFYIYGDVLFTVSEISPRNWKIIRIDDLTRG